MSVPNSLHPVLLGALAALAGAVSAFAGDLPAFKAAPAEPVHLCDAFGAGFFYIPGTDTCLKPGGLVMGEMRGFSPSYNIVGIPFYGQGIPRSGTGFIPRFGQYSNWRSRDALHFNALGRFEFDTRTATPYGTLRSFFRIDSYWGSGGNSAAGNLGNVAANTTAQTRLTRESTIVNKAFMQFAGFTMGRAQSFFDFYVDAYNFAALRGSNATTGLIAYTGVLGRGFSATLSIEDSAARRAAILSTLAGTTGQPLSINSISAVSFQGTPGGGLYPDVVANLRLDQPWGSMQVSGAAHPIRASLFTAGALARDPSAYAFPVLTSTSYGFAVQGGLQINLEALSPSDKFWLQAAYEKGAYGYIAGNNLAFIYAPVNANRLQGASYAPLDYALGWVPQINADCVWTGSLQCEKQWGFDVTGAFRHHWTPNLASSLVGSYQEVHYSANALAGYGGAVGVSNLKELRVGTNLLWIPVRGFMIGAEFMYLNLNQTRPYGLAPDYGPNSLSAAGLPTFQGNQSEYEGRLRILRAF